MKEGFFEGQDFKNGEFKALTPKYYPIKYQKYIIPRKINLQWSKLEYPGLLGASLLVR